MVRPSVVLMAKVGMICIVLLAGDVSFCDSNGDVLTGRILERLGHR